MCSFHLTDFVAKSNTKLLVLFSLLIKVSMTYCETFHWNISLLTSLPSNNFKTSVDYLVVTDPVDYTFVVRSSNILPFVGYSEIVSPFQNYLSSPYILKVTVFDSAEKTAQSLMRSLVLNGVKPNMKLVYVSETSSVDVGQNTIEIQGILQKDDPDDDSAELSNICWVFPLNIYRAVKVLLSFSYISIGPSYIMPKKVAYHGISSEYLEDADSVSIPAENSLQISFFCSSLVGKNELIILSHDEFTTNFIKKLPTLQDYRSRCPNTPTITASSSNVLVHFTQGGAYLIFYDDTKKSPDSQVIRYKGNAICPIHVDVKRNFNDNIILVSTGGLLLFLQFNLSMETNGKLKFEVNELTDKDDQSVCSFLSLSQCLIISHTFTKQCCNVYVLLKFPNSNQFLLVIYKSNKVCKNGTWEELIRFYDRLPQTYLATALNYVLLKNVYYSNGVPININGITDIKIASNCVFIWGNVLLIYAIKPSLLFAVLTKPQPNPSLFFDGQEIKQFVSESNSNKIALMTSNGDIWLGKISCCVSPVKIEKHSKSLAFYNIPSLSNVIGLFYDSFRVLHILSLQSQVTKQEINVTTSVADYSIVVTTSCLDLNQFSRKREFVFKPPRVWPLNLQVNSSELRELNEFDKHASIVTYDNEEFVVNRVSTYFVLNSEGFGVRKWWETAYNSRKWYFSSTSFHDYLEYVSDNNLRIGVDWVAYVSKNDYALKNQTRSHICSSPLKVYLDRNMTFRIKMILEPFQLSNIFQEGLYLVAVSTNNDLLDIKISKLRQPKFVEFNIALTGKPTQQQPTGQNLQTVSAIFSPWYQGQLNLTNSEELYVEVQVGCPPGITLHFDNRASIATFASRGRGDVLGCLENNLDLPCVTLSEFFPMFYLMDHVFQETTPFEGNFTFQVVGGGVGYQENIKYFTQEEIALYNYIPGKTENAKSSFWLPTNEEEALMMKDNQTGLLIFDSQKQSKIIFDCQINSPCGDIPLISYNPSEYFLVIEVSNRGVDSSTNCDFTNRFILQLVGIELNPLSHMYVMLCTIFISFAGIYMYYLFGGEKGKKILKQCLPAKLQSKKWRDISEQFCLARKVHAKDSADTDATDHKTTTLSDGFSFPYIRPSNSGRGVPRDGVSGVSGPLIKISEATVGASMAE